MNTRADVVNYASERAIGSVGNSAKEISSIIGSNTGFWEHEFKQRAIEVILDAQQRAEKNKNPRMTGNISIKNAFSEEYCSNPKKYLKAIESELMTRINRENIFLRDFIINNDTLSEKVKKFMIREVSEVSGPWLAESEVLSVIDENSKIIVKTRSSECYYYIKSTSEVFLRDFIINNDTLSEKAKEFMTVTASEVNGPWLLENQVQSVTQEDNKIIVKTRSGASYYYIKN